jgi:hypothetical protein
MIKLSFTSTAVQKRQFRKKRRRKQTKDNLMTTLGQTTKNSNAIFCQKSVELTSGIALPLARDVSPILHHVLESKMICEKSHK